MNQRMTMAELANLGGLANLRSSASGNPLRAIAEAAVSAQEKARSERKAADATPTNGKISQEAKKRKSNAPPSATFAAIFPKDGEIVFVLPLPPKELSPNGRSYWRKKAEAVKKYRETCATLMRRSNQGSIPGRVVIDLDFYLCKVANDKHSYYPRDEDNARAAMKAAQDALKDAGVIQGDGKKHVRVGSTRLRTTEKEHERLTCVVMTIRGEG